MGGVDTWSKLGVVGANSVVTGRRAGVTRREATANGVVHDLLEGLLHPVDLFRDHPGYVGIEGESGSHLRHHDALLF